MSKIMNMNSVPILNATDFYENFNILDVIKQRKACVSFALGHLKRSRSLNLHHIGVLEKCLDSKTEVNFANPDDYWKFEKDRCKAQCNELVGFEEQSAVVKKIFEKYKTEFSNKERRILLILIASVLLADKTEACTDKISASKIKSAFNNTEDETDEEIISLKGTPCIVTLTDSEKRYRLTYDPRQRPSSEKRYQTWTVQAKVDSQLELFDFVSSATVKKIFLKSGEKIFFLVLNEAVVKVLPNEVKNGKNNLKREKDKIYFNGNICSIIPPEASSFAVGASFDFPWLLCVCDGHIRYIQNCDGIDFRKTVDEQVAVISEVYVENAKPVIVRNDGKIWNANGGRFE